jgi:hypothetical protein
VKGKRKIKGERERAIRENQMREPVETTINGISSKKRAKH